MLRSENVSDHEVVGEAGDGLARVGKARGSSDGRDITIRVRHGDMRCVGGYVDRVSCARRCAVEASEGRFWKTELRKEIKITPPTSVTSVTPPAGKSF